MILADFLKNNFFKNKKGALIITALAIGVFLLIFSSFIGGEVDSAAQTDTLSEYKTKLEEELADICASVEGVGRCRVTLSFERGAENSYKGSNLIESKPPKVMGVTVVCRGADSDEVRLEIVGMMTALFDIGANRVAVLKLNS